MQAEYYKYLITKQINHKVSLCPITYSLYGQGNMKHQSKRFKNRGFSSYNFSYITYQKLFGMIRNLSFIIEQKVLHKHCSVKKSGRGINYGWHHSCSHI